MYRTHAENCDTWILRCLTFCMHEVMLKDMVHAGVGCLYDSIWYTLWHYGISTVGRPIFAHILIEHPVWRIWCARACLWNVCNAAACNWERSTGRWPLHMWCVLKWPHRISGKYTCFLVGKQHWTLPQNIRLTRPLVCGPMFFLLFHVPHCSKTVKRLLMLLLLKLRREWGQTRREVPNRVGRLETPSASAIRIR
jgi:hypothetical protein